MILLGTVALVQDKLIQALYDTALHEGDWRPALHLSADSLGCAEICFSAFSGGAAATYETTRRVLGEEAWDRYDRYYGALDPKIGLISRRGDGFVFNDSDHFDDGFVARDPFYQEFTRWAGLRHTLDMTMGAASERPAFLAAMRTPAQGPFQPASEQAFRTIAGHIGRVHQLRSRIEGLEALSRHAEAALDGLAFALAVLDERGRAILANRRAQRLTTEGGPLQWRDGKLAARAPSADRQLQAMIERAQTGAELAAASMRITRPDEGDWIVWVMRLPPTSTLAQGVPAVLVLVGDSTLKGRVRREDLVSLYGLTPAEADLAVALAAGRTLREAAQARDVSYWTVRGQLAALLEKTGLHRQADLALLIAGLPGAILDDA